ncbi:MAG: hypothetical protein M0P47_09185 [Bacteroidales bacterium]|jgi:hypothetical protein|nr:hypothetical protein [Bacteroidales bacterium]
MKKLIILAIIAIIPLIGMSQGISWKRVLDAKTITQDTTILLTTSGVYSSWSITILCGTTTSTTSTVKVQVSPDNSSWIDYANLSSATLVSDGVKAFEDDRCSFRYMRLNFTIEAGQTLPATVWYVFKTLN